MLLLRSTSITLLNGRELITHDASKLKYPPGVIIPNDNNYTVVYDGVFVPQVDKQEYVSKDKFKAFQLSAGVGFRSDFDFNENLSMNFDGRAVFGIFDPRKDSYVNSLKSGSAADPRPDLYGQRREAYLYATIGISRIFQIKQKHQPKQSRRPIGLSSPVMARNLVTSRLDTGYWYWKLGIQITNGQYQSPITIIKKEKALPSSGTGQFTKHPKSINLSSFGKV